MSSRGRCCCEDRACWSVEDDFDREDSDDPGTYWVEVGGSTDWDIVDEEIHEIVEGPLITTHRQPDPVRSGAKYKVESHNDEYLILSTNPHELDADQWQRLWELRDVLAELSDGQRWSCDSSNGCPGDEISF